MTNNGEKPPGPMPWLRLWHSFLDSAKVQRVTEVLRARYVNLLCVACKFDQSGRLPSVEETAFMLRSDVKLTRDTLEALAQAGLIDKRAKSYHIHDWEQWQFSRSKAADKQKRYRDRRNALRNALPDTLRNGDVTEASRVTSSRARSEAEAEKEKKDLLPGVLAGEPVPACAPAHATHAHVRESRNGKPTRPGESAQAALERRRAEMRREPPPAPASDPILRADEQGRESSK